METDPLIGTWLGQYQVLERLGEGGMARVYKASQPRLKRHVALKIILPEAAARPGFRERFEREAQLIANLHHANIVAVYDFGEVNHLSYLVMQYVGGGTLSGQMRAGQPMAYPRAIHYIAQMAHALHHAHSHGVIHRDIKPSNMLLDDTDPNHLLLSDFGIAKVLSSRAEEGAAQPGGAGLVTTTGNVIGTPEFMAPEQAQGQEIDARSDIYALGLVLYYLLTGQLAFRAPTPLAVLYQQVNVTPAPVTQVNPTVPPRLSEVAALALEKDPAKRFQSAEAFARALESTLLSASQIDAAPTLLARIDPTVVAPGLQPPAGHSTGAPPTPVLTQPAASASQVAGAITAPGTPTQVTPPPPGMPSSPELLGRASMPSGTPGSPGGVWGRAPGAPGLASGAAPPVGFHTAPTPLPGQIPGGAALPARPIQPARRKALPWMAVGVALILILTLLIALPGHPLLTLFKLGGSPSPTATPGGTPVTGAITDTFVVNALGWQTSNIDGDPQLNWKLGHGVYDIRIPAGNSYGRTYFPFPSKLGKVPANFTLEITVQQVSGSDVVGFGLMIRQSVGTSGTVQGYAFTLDSQGGYQFVKYPSTDQNASFTDGTPTILAGLGKTNVLKVVVQGSTFTLYANGTLLPGSFSDSEYASGQVGLVVTGNTTQAEEYQFTSFSLTPA